uniref:ATP-dependent Clp protease proteolytic subunit n=1 Tax=Rhodopseudomonas palustris (strain DX-1) TaxID=652103 RepID=E6VC28_RHOPX
MATLSQRFQIWLSGNPDDAVLRMIFRLLIVGAVVVLAYDLAGPESGGAQRETSPLSLPSFPEVLSPWLPDGDRLTPLPQPGGALGKPMTFELVSGGRLQANGTITPGSAEAFGKELARHAEYIKTVVLNSPGGSVSDALAIGRMIREHRLATEVEAGKYCASSCPLVLFGGTERRVGAKAAVGVHQVFAVNAGETAASPPRDQMSDAQRISARCQRYLSEMGIDLEVWIRAMETPKDRLFVFKPEELNKYRIVTAETSAPKS